MLMCMGETWYLATEMQMFLVSPFIIWPLWRWKRTGVAWVLLIMTGLVGGLVTIFIVWDIPAAGFPTRPFVFALMKSY